MRLFNHCLGDDGAVLQHVLQINQIAVMFLLSVIIGVMKMDDTFLVRLYNVLRQKNAGRQILADSTGHVIALCTVDHRILIGIFLLHQLIALLDQRQNALIR